jgi:hypothetical protein
MAREANLERGVLEHFLINLCCILHV